MPRPDRIPRPGIWHGYRPRPRKRQETPTRVRTRPPKKLIIGRWWIPRCESRFAAEALSEFLTPILTPNSLVSNGLHSWRVEPEHKPGHLHPELPIARTPQRHTGGDARARRGAVPSGSQDCARCGRGRHISCGWTNLAGGEFSSARRNRTARMAADKCMTSGVGPPAEGPNPLHLLFALSADIYARTDRRERTRELWPQSGN